MIIPIGIAVLLGFLIFLSFSIPILAHQKGVQWWKVRNIYHVMIFSTGGLVPLFIRSFLLAGVGILTTIGLLSIYYWVTGKNAISTFYEIMRREKVSPSERSIYTATTNFLLVMLMIITWNTPIFFTIGLFIMAWGDSSAEVIGRTAGEIEYQVVSTKTIRGSITVFVVSLIVVYSGLFLIDSISNYSALYLVGIALASMIAESMSYKFVDNVLMPYVGTLALKYPILDILG